MMPSPYRSAEPEQSGAISSRPVPVDGPLGRTSASSARMPPSPRLSARMTMERYLKVTTKLSDQKISDRIAQHVLGGHRKAVGPKKHSLNAYSGLVPMSP